ncbi:MAG: ABC transporter ATP-binding protein [Legionella sp.]|uniref:ABC transporter ATP-binding protein n=1 Tax=Legionella sp. TaxID=459 RepID=UPI0039E3219F
MIKLEDVHLSYFVTGVKTHSLQAQVYQQLKKFVGGSIDRGGATAQVQALRNINLEVKDGCRLGIVGHNGAGKTTLLRVLSGAYKPTSGSITIKGRIHALTDFSLGMELNSSGIKNIIFRLVFMGYTFKQAREAIDEIVEFSELGDFIHLPVSTYSTGMFMRLAFAISTHFMPDILILDEIIGAGDEDFKKKCRERLNTLFQQSRIVILSTHDMAALKEYCDTAILMKRGEIVGKGEPQEIIKMHQQPELA